MMKPSEFFKLLDQNALDTTSNHLDKQYNTKSEPNFQDPQESLTGDKLLELAQAKKTKESIEVSKGRLNVDNNTTNTPIKTF